MDAFTNTSVAPKKLKPHEKRAALEAAYEPPVFVGASRQHGRAMARKARKEATRPGLHTKKHANPRDVATLVYARPGSPCRRIVYVKAPPGFDAWLHPTKGYRCQRVAS